MYKLDRYFFERYGIDFLDANRRFGIDIDRHDIGKSNKVSLNAAKWSAALDYNTNLVSLIKELEKKGVIRIDMEKINLDGANPFNPSTIIAWCKV